ncbi:CubicO group peptidase (beta-lactamase class C family) [Pseudoduganella lurida]|uniref:CubicO group peptidase (Beta-lactamase class C family) n=1 Tax=Pseudoduganella lurida TaxID=1036180 RepID=A0A562QZ71_9BURK|nr:serine hydrolase domain-containing protein [Pseudoduganella lurida]TWI62118.1 CubicO group peptidase (beta-lactamase class C family) [Pseudoduganella lurida]
MRPVPLLPLFTAFFLLTAPQAYADPLDDRIAQEMERRHVPGVSVLVLRDGKVIKEKGYGFANLEHRVPVNADTVFQSGSVGKTFTAALVLLLAGDGKLNLDDPIERHLANTPPAWKAITIRHLLTHTSGLGDPYERIDFRKDYADEELIALEAAIPVLFAPGERFSYSNMGYHLLGFICNKAGGKFYGDQLRERIFAPLGMGTRIISESDIVPHRAAGYEWENGAVRNQAWVAPKLNTTADGSLYLTARDLARWDQALYGNRILDAQQRTASWTPTRLNDGKESDYGYGWQLGQRNGHTLISHSGAWQGFKSQLSRFVDDRFTVIVLANSANANPGKFADLVAAHFIPALAAVPAPPIADAEPAVTAAVRAAVASLAAGARPAGLAPAAERRFSPEAVAGLSAELKSFGTLQTVELLARTSEGDLTRYRYRFRFAGDTVLVTCVRDKTGLIEKLWMTPE